MSNKLLRRGMSYLLAFLMIFTTIFATNFYSARAEEIDIEENILSEDDGLLLDDAAVADDVDIADEEILEDETVDVKEEILSEPEGNPTFVNSGLVICPEGETDFVKSTEMQVAVEYKFYLGINKGNDEDAIDSANVISLGSSDIEKIQLFEYTDSESYEISDSDYSLSCEDGLFTLILDYQRCGNYSLKWNCEEDSYDGSFAIFKVNAPAVGLFETSALDSESYKYTFSKDKEIAEDAALSFEEAMYGKKEFLIFVPEHTLTESAENIVIRSLNTVEAGDEAEWTDASWTTMHGGSNNFYEIDGVELIDEADHSVNYYGVKISGDVFKVILTKNSDCNYPLSSYRVEIGTITDDVFTPAYRVSYAPYVCDENTFADVVVDDAEFCGENVFSNPYLKGDADKKPITGLDYSERSYKNNIYIGEASVELTPSADFAGAKAFTKTFKITPMDLATYIDDENIDVSIFAYYNPEEKKVTSYKIYSEELYENVDYTVEYGYVFDEENKKYVKASGDLDLDTLYYAKLTGMGKFTGEYYAYYYLRKKEIRKENFIIVSEPSFDGTVKTGEDFEFRCVVDGKKLVYGKDFVMKYNGEEFAQTEYDDYSVSIEGTGNYSGSFTITVSIDRSDLSKAVVKYINAAGKEVDLPKEFTLGQDLSLAVYLNGTKISPELYEAGLYGLDPNKKTGQLIISPMSNGFFYAKYIKEITLNPNFTAANDITVEFVEGGSYAYNGESVCPSVIVKQGEKELEYGEDYSVYYENNLNVGKGKVIVSGNWDYFGEIKKEFTITSVDSKDIYVEVSATAEYNPIFGEAIPNIIVKATEDSTYSFPEEDYKVTFTNNKVPGEASWKIEFPGKNIVGQPKEGKFTVLAAAMNDDNIRVYEDQFFTSTADMVVPNLDVYYAVDSDTSVVLKAGTDYDLTVAAADENGKVEDGKIKVPSEGNYAYTATITGKGNFSGTAKCTFYANLLSPVDISGYMVTGLNPVYEVTSLPGPECLMGNIVVKDGETIVDSELYSIDCDKSELNEYGIGKLSFIVNGTAPAAKGSIVVSVEVVPTDLSKRDVSLSMIKCPYVDYETLEVMDATFQVDVSGYGSLNDEDYSFTYALKNDDGTFTDYENVPFDSEAEIFVKIVAKAHFTGESDYMSVGRAHKIYLEDIQDPDEGQVFTVSAPKNFKYDGKAHKQKLTVKLGDQKFVVGKDCELGYRDWNSGTIVDEPVNAGRYVVEVIGIGKYWGTVTPAISGKALSEENVAFFEVTPASISKAKITYTKSFDYDASKLEDGFKGWGEVSKVQFGKKELIEGVDYKVVFENNYKPGVATIKISGIGNYTGIVTKTYTIKGSVDINDEDVDVYVAPEASFSPAGAKPEINIFYKGEQLVENKDYTVTYSNNKKITTDKKATVTIKGKGQYKGTRATQYDFSVVAGKFSELEDRMTYGKAKIYGLPMIPGESMYLYGATYTGKAQSPDPQLKIDGKALKLGKDYEIKFVSVGGMFSSWLNTTNPLPGGVLLDSVIESGQYGVVFIGLGNYAGEYVPENLSLIVSAPDASKIKVKTKTLDYTGSDAEGAITSVMYGKTKLVENRDYVVSYNYEYENYLLEDALSIKSGIKIPSFKPVIGNSINVALDNDEELDSISAGKKTAYVVGIGNYSSIGAKKVSYTIKGFDISKAKFTVKNISYCPEGYYAVFDPYTDIEATYKANGETIKLIFGVDYTVTNYEDIMNNFKVGKHTAKVEGLGQFSGTKKVTVKVVPVELTKDTFDYIWYAVGLDEGYAPYNKKGVKDLIGDVYYSTWKLKEGVDYTVTYKNNKKIASRDSKKAPTVTIKFKGGFKGKITVKFDIVKNDLNCIDYSYTGGTDADYKIKTVFESDVNGKLKEGTDYKLVGYYYDGAFAVENNGKLSYRKYGEAVQEGDKIAAGTRICAVYEGTGKYYEGKLYVSYTVKPVTQ